MGGPVNGSSRTDSALPESEPSFSRGTVLQDTWLFFTRTLVQYLTFERYYVCFCLLALLDPCYLNTETTQLQILETGFIYIIKKH